MTLSDLRNQVLIWLDDPNGGYFTTPMVNTWLNNAQRELQKILLGKGENWYMRCQQTTLVINQPLYVLPQDFRQVHRLEIITAGVPPNEDRSVVAPITFNQQDYNPAKTGTPESYVLKKNVIQLFPTPDTAYTLRMNYAYMVTDMVLDTDTPDIPVQYQEYLAVLATMDGALKDKTEMSGLIEKKQRYEELMDADADERRIDQPRSVVITEDDGFGKMF